MALLEHARPSVLFCLSPAEAATDSRGLFKKGYHDRELSRISGFGS